MFLEIDSQEALDNFLYEVDYLHDGILREAAFLFSGFVDDKFQLFGNGESYDARLIFQTQFAETPCVELVFEDVSEIALNSTYPLVPSGSYCEDEITFHLGNSSAGNFFGVRSRRVKYRILDISCLGQGTLSIDTIPIGEINLALFLEEGWVQCPSCSNAVNIIETKKIVRCDKCHKILEIPYKKTKIG